MFLFYFLPLTLLFYYIAPQKAKNLVLLLASLAFYLFGEVKYTFLLVFCALFHYGAGLLLSRLNRPALRRGVLWTSVAFSLLFLGYYKYAGFLAEALSPLLGRLSAFTPPPLPIGISFYTFQAMSYTVDVYRRDAVARKEPLSFLTYLCLFPQLIAGPIVRYTDVAKELDDREESLPGVASGLLLFAVGLGKKVILADTLGALTASYRTTDAPSLLFAWLAALAFTFEIYFDFSGYSDMAVGLGRMFGFHFPENFRYPYIAVSITDFWRRWHITLSSFFRDYVYIPLGGNRKGKVRLALNIAVVWLLTGLWHGAAWTFVAWGGLYALLLLWEKFGGLALLSRLPRGLSSGFGWVYTFFFTVMGFTLFNAPSLTAALQDISVLLGFSSLPAVTPAAWHALKSYALLLIIAALGATPLPRRLWHWFTSRTDRVPAGVILRPAVVLTLLVSALSLTVNSTFHPFLYFRF